MVDPASSPVIVSAIIVSFNTRELTLRCIMELLRNSAGMGLEIWLVDNASNDGSAAAVRLAFPQVHVIEPGRNLGFGAANNLAMDKATGRYFLLLNSDAFVHAECLPELVRELDTQVQAGVVGPRLLNSDGTLQRSCWRFPSPMRAWIECFWLPRLFSGNRTLGDFARWPHDSNREVDFIIGACLLVRREIFSQVGGFDERFFLYSEETDWQRRIRDAGWEVLFNTRAVATHLGGASGKDDYSGTRRLFFESLDRYILKHHGLMGLCSMRVAQLIRYILRATAWSCTAVFSGMTANSTARVRREIHFLRHQVFAKFPR